MKDFRVSVGALAHWMNAIRNLPSHEERTRALDALWDGQLDSKAWLVSKLAESTMGPANIYIFGGWIGILASMIIEHDDIEVRRIRSIDLDPWCETIADTVNKPHEIDGWRFKAEIADMKTYVYSNQYRPDIVINTSSEHVTQEVYDEWYKKIPNGTLVVVQGNNYFDCVEHVRCSSSLDEFIRMNRRDNSRTYYEGEFVTNMYTRYMAIWRKNCF